MSYAWNDKLCFIHIPKCGGEAAAAYLKERIPDLNVSPPRTHISLVDFGKNIKPVSTMERVIALIRNPYERELSQWAFWRDEYDRGRRTLDFTLAHSMDFGADFIKHIRSSHHAANQWKRYGDFYLWWLVVGNTLPDNLEIVKLEEADENLPPLVDPYASEDAEFTQQNTSSHGDARDCYDEDAIQAVNRKYQWALQEKYDAWTCELATA